MDFGWVPCNTSGASRRKTSVQQGNTVLSRAEGARAAEVIWRRSTCILLFPIEAIEDRLWPSAAERRPASEVSLLALC
jgi:hypothetical protein